MIGNQIPASIDLPPLYMTLCMNRPTHHDPVSSDLSHYHPAKRAEMDQKLPALLALDAQGVWKDDPLVN